MKLNKKIIRDLILIFVVFIFLSVLLLSKIWSHGSFVPEWDEAFHLKLGFYFFEAFKWQDWNWIKALLTTEDGGIYPPLYHILIAISYFFFGVSSNASIYVNLIFILILMTSTYGLGVQLGNRTAGLLTAFFVPMLPIFLALQERADIGYASTALFVTSFWAMFATNGFTNRRYSIIFGVIILLELLTKWPFVVPSLPILYYAITNFYSLKKGRKKILLNWLLVTTIAIPGITWYLFNHETIINGLDFFWNPKGFPQLIWSSPHGFDLNNLLLYVITYPIQGSGVGVVVLLYFIGIYFVRNVSVRLRYLLSSVTVTLIVLTYLNDKSAFYIAYAYPPLMLATIKTVIEIKNKLNRYILITIFCLAILTNFVLSHIKTANYQVVLLDLNKIQLDIFPTYTSKFTGDTWHTYKRVYDELNQNNCKKGILFFPDNRFLNWPTLDYFLKINEIKILSRPAYNFYNPATDRTFNLNVVNSFDCVVTKSGSPGIFSNKYVIKYVYDHLFLNPKWRKNIIELPDDSEVTIFEQLY